MNEFVAINIQNGLKAEYLVSKVASLLKKQRGTHIVIRVVSPSYTDETQEKKDEA